MAHGKSIITLILTGKPESRERSSTFPLLHDDRNLAAAYGAGLSGGSGSGVGDISETLTNVSGSTASVTYTVTPTGLNGCLGDDFDLVVPIEAEPVGSANTETAVCSGIGFTVDLQANIDLTNVVASTFAWTAVYPAGLTGGVASGTGDIIETLSNVTGGTLNAVYTVTPRASGGNVGA